MTTDTTVILEKLDSIQQQLGNIAARMTSADQLLTNDDEEALAAADADLEAGRTKRLA